MAPDPNVLIENAIRFHLAELWSGDGLAPPGVPLKFKPKTKRTYYKIDLRTGQDYMVFGLPLVWQIAQQGMRDYPAVMKLSHYRCYGPTRIQPGIYAVHHLVCHEFAHLCVRRREYNQRTPAANLSTPHGSVFRIELRRILRQYDPHANDNLLFNTYRWAFDAKGIPYA